MNKASEWAEKYQAAYGIGGSAPELWLTTTNMRIPSERVLVGPVGDLQGGGWSIDRDEALKLAHWILDTFGESP